jgi:hypothetical protein
MDINKKFLAENAGTTYFLLSEESMACFGFNLKTWADERVVRVDVHKKFAGTPRHFTVATESGRTFDVTTGTLIPLAAFGA